MFYVVDRWGVCIKEFTTREDAEAFCENQNVRYQFTVQDHMGE